MGIEICFPLIPSLKHLENFALRCSELNIIEGEEGEIIGSLPSLSLFRCQLFLIGSLPKSVQALFTSSELNAWALIIP